MVMGKTMWAGRAIGMAAGLTMTAMAAAEAGMIDDWYDGKVAAAKPAITYAGPPITIRWSHPSGAASIVPPIYNRGLDRLAADTGGKLTYKEFGGGTLHGAKDGFKAVRDGLTDYATCYTSYEGRGFEMTRIFEFPFIAPINAIAGTRIAMELAPKYFKPEFERQETLFGYHVTFTPTDIMSRRPIRKLEDLKGLKVTAHGFDPRAAQALGMTLVNIPYTELYQAMSQGIVDAVIWVDSGFLPYKIYEVAKFHTTVGLSSGGIPTCINRDFFGKLPTDLKQAFYRFQQLTAMGLADKVFVQFGTDARKKYQEAGVELIALPPEELARWQTAIEPILEDWIKAQEAAGRPARQMIKDIEALKTKYAALSNDELMRIAIEDPVPGIIGY